MNSKTRSGLRTGLRYAVHAPLYEFIIPFTLLHFVSLLPVPQLCVGVV